MVKLKRKNAILSVVQYGLLLLVLYILQGLIFPWFMTGFVPLLLCSAVAGVAHFEGSVKGGVFGLFAGILMDLSLGKPLIVFTIMLTVMGLVIGALGESLLTKRFISYIFSNIVTLIIAAFVQMFSLLFFTDASVWHLVLTAVLQTVISLIFAAPLYPIIKRMALKKQE